MTVHRIRMLTERESEKHSQAMAYGFDELENPICELRLMAKLARRETLDDEDDELRVFTVLRLTEMAEQLYKDYYEISRSADPRIKRRAIA
jgi:hypothetical protein